MNSQTRRKRDIKRKFSATLNADPPNLTFSLRGLRANLDNASTQLISVLQENIIAKQLVLKFFSQHLQNLLFQVACAHKVEVNFQSLSGKTIACLEGVSQFVQKALAEMQYLVKEHEFPAEWQSQVKTKQLFALVEDSPDWKGVKEKFSATMPDAQIMSIKRVQNTWLWGKYVKHKYMLYKRNRGNVNEKNLFRGTKDIDPILICGSDEGFDVGYNVHGMRDQANYFAVNASYSDSYAYTTTSGQKQVFLARVLAGNSRQMGDEMPDSPSQVFFDTDMGHSRGSQVYLTYDNQKVYPAYLITYERRKSGREKALLKVKEVVGWLRNDATTTSGSDTGLNGNLSFPSTWELPATTLQLKPVNWQSSEWRDVEDKMLESVATVSIVKIERIQNPWLWEKYAFCKERMAKKNHGVVNERKLFHGTRQTQPEKVYASEHGFDFRYGSNGLWGNGAYFAVQAKYSAQNFAYRNSSGFFQIILALVLTGESVLVAPDSALSKPPVKPKPGGNVALVEELYDSVKGHTAGTDMYIVYDHDKTYPAYLITFQ